MPHYRLIHFELALDIFGQRDASFLPLEISFLCSEEAMSKRKWGSLQLRHGLTPNRNAQMTLQSKILPKDRSHSVTNHSYPPLLSYVLGFHRCCHRLLRRFLLLPRHFHRFVAEREIYKIQGF